MDETIANQMLERLRQLERNISAAVMLVSNVSREAGEKVGELETKLLAAELKIKNLETPREQLRSFAKFLEYYLQTNEITEVPTYKDLDQVLDRMCVTETILYNAVSDYEEGFTGAATIANAAAEISLVAMTIVEMAKCLVNTENEEQEGYVLGEDVTDLATTKDTEFAYSRSDTSL